MTAIQTRSKTAMEPTEADNPINVRHLLDDIINKDWPRVKRLIRGLPDGGFDEKVDDTNMTLLGAALHKGAPLDVVSLLASVNVNKESHGRPPLMHAIGTENTVHCIHSLYYTVYKTYINIILLY